MHENSYVDGVIIDICKRSFCIVSDKGAEQVIFCNTPTEFLDVLEVCHQFLTEDEIEYATIVTKPKRRTRKRKPTSDTNEKL
jgi:hypothetical protein|tara:strand:+ start:315 stop:560 length:246 start_codon:yes stop_codon:yes gene_type:complete